MCLFNIPTNCSLCTLLMEDPRQPSLYWMSGLSLVATPLLLLSAVGNVLGGKEKFYSWLVSSYLVSRALVNVNVAILALSVGDWKGCSFPDFSIKFLYMLSLCWIFSINASMCRTFRLVQQLSITKMGQRDYLAILTFCLTLPTIAVGGSYLSGRGALICGQRCLLYGSQAGKIYSPVILTLIIGSVILFTITGSTIWSLRLQSNATLQREETAMKSFKIFAKFFLLTGPIWFVRIILLLFQFTGMYTTWYGVVLESLFSTPEIVLCILILTRPELRDWVVNKLN